MSSVSLPLDDILMDVCKLGLKTFVRNKLWVAGLFTTEQLALCSKHNLAQIRGLGDVGLRNIEECLALFDMTLKPNPPELELHHFPQRISHEERFWAKVNKTDTCWLWTAHCNADGYGEFSINGARILAHRASYLLEHGILPEGLQVLHSCDKPPCVRPTHLFLGTQQDNINDMIVKERDNFFNRNVLF